MKDTIITDNIILMKDTIAQINHSINVNLANNEDSQFLTNIVTIGIAFFAGIFALAQVRYNIVSNARINWIENLRETISTYTMEVSNCSTLISNMVDEGLNNPESELNNILIKHYPNYLKSSNEIERLGNKILLYLNSEKTEHKIIEQNIEMIYQQLVKINIVSIDTEILNKSLTVIIKNSKIIFKVEWEKSKRIFGIFRI